MAAAFADPVGAFCAHGACDRQARTDGPLAQQTFAVKDLFDVAGVPTGAGSPEYLASHGVPVETAPAVQLLLDAGARLVGTTHTDELAWSLNGQNVHYGTPINVAAPGRIPGGSSSGSAAATAAGLVDFAVGSDTGGSVRLPASYCGLYGIRPTYGRIDISRAVPLAPSYDTVGWFARAPALLARVGAVLFGPAPAAPTPNRLLLAEDLFDFAGETVRSALADAIARVAERIGPPQPVSVADGALETWRDVFRTIQAHEAWATHGAWITQSRPSLGPGIADRFAAAAALDPGLVSEAKRARADISRRLAGLLTPGTVLLAPSAPGVAPRLDADAGALEVFRARALALLCPAGHAGLPQISLPLSRLEGLPIGLSIIGPRFYDERLLDLATQVPLHATDDN